MQHLSFTGLRAHSARIRPILTRSWLDALALLVLVAVAISRSRSYHGVVIDDSFITFRHSANLLRGHGFSCDPTEHVEGTSSPLFAMLMVVPIGFGLEPYGVATWITTFAFAVCVPVAYLTVRAALPEVEGRWLGLCASVLVAASPILAFHSQTGLETVLYAALLAAAVWQLIRCFSLEKASSTWATIMGVASLTRPEAPLFFVMFLGFFVFARRGKPNRLASIIRTVRAFALIWAPWLLFRVVYYGKWWSNSVVAKSGYSMGPQHARIAGFFGRLLHGEGTALLVQFVTDYSLQLAMLLGAIVMRRVRLPILLVVALTGAHALMVTWNGGDWMPHFRLLTACIVPLAAAAAVGLRGFLFYREQQGFRHLPSLLLMVLACSASIPRGPKLETKIPAVKDLPELRELGTRLTAVTLPDDLVVSAMAGILPYYWDVRAIDMFGICDTHISSTGKPLPLGIGRFDPAYLASKRPTFYAFEYAFLAADFYESAEFAPHRGGYWMFQYPYGYLGSKTWNTPTILVRKDRRDLDRLTRELGVKLVDPEQELRRTGFVRPPL